MKTDECGNGLCDGCGQPFCNCDGESVAVGGEWLCGDCVRKRIAEAEARKDALIAAAIRANNGNMNLPGAWIVHVDGVYPEDMKQARAREENDGSN